MHRDLLSLLESFNVAGNLNAAPANVQCAGSSQRQAGADVFAAATETLQSHGFAADVRTVRLSSYSIEGAVAVYLQPGDARIEWIDGPDGSAPARHRFRFEGREKGGVTLFSGTTDAEVAAFVESLTSPNARDILPVRDTPKEWDPHTFDATDLDLRLQMEVLGLFRIAGF